MKAHPPKKEMHSIDDKSSYLPQHRKQQFAAMTWVWIVVVFIIGMIPVLNLTLIPALAFVAIAAFSYFGIKRLAKG